MFLDQHPSAPERTFLSAIFWRQRKPLLKQHSYKPIYLMGWHKGCVFGVKLLQNKQKIFLQVLEESTLHFQGTISFSVIIHKRGDTSQRCSLHTDRSLSKHLAVSTQSRSKSLTSSVMNALFIPYSHHRRLQTSIRGVH